MAKEVQKKGFTLVELLVVIGIIGILIAVVALGLGGARRAARDDRRVADLRQVEQALTLYFLKCRMYPGNYDVATDECKGGELIGDITDPANSTDNPDNWSKLTNVLNDADLGFGTIPGDPLAGVGQNYFYRVQLGQSGITPPAQCYVLGAAMETPGHRSLASSSDLDSASFNTASILPAPPACSNPGCKNLFPVATANLCDDPEYCVGNKDCFFGN